MEEIWEAFAQATEQIAWALVKDGSIKIKLSPTDLDLEVVHIEVEDDGTTVLRVAVPEVAA